MRIDKHGQQVAAYDFGRDVMPAVYRHNGTCSTVTNDTHACTAS
jgi:hypothetical protein